jgi:16S rRNA C1402 N4-methylase RsmH
VDSADRGFSFQRDGPLDMRMAPGAALDAATIVNGWPEAELGRLFREYGEERNWRRIAIRSAASVCKASRHDIVNEYVQPVAVCGDDCK